MIEVEHLTKRYGSFTAVDEISFQVRQGEIVGFLGPNGAGKTTTMRVLSCFLSASEGSARVAGYDIFEDPLEVKRRIGYLPETPPLYMDMRVKHYLGFVAKIKGVPKANREGRIARVMDQCGLSDRADQLCGHLSRGYRQRVGLAQAIIHDPDVIIMDEPTAGLDPNQVREVRHLIQELAEKRTVILSTHILPEVEMTCHRVLIIANGKIVAEDRTENLSEKLMGSRRIYLEISGEAEKAMAAIQMVPGVQQVFLAEGRAEDAPPGLYVDTPVGDDLRAALAACVAKQGIGLLEIRQEGMSLEDIFHELTTEEATD
ncbi:MAG: ABC transporter ATP-binding protein [bacterium]|nr:ABC transporter ATP-binding protein [bacterium]